MVRSLPLVLVLVLCLSLPAAAGSFTADFNSGADPQLAYSPDPNGVVGVSYTGGQAVFSILPPYTTEDNWTNGYTQLATRFGILGDYTVTVLMDPTAMQNTWPDLSSGGLAVGQTSLWYQPGLFSMVDHNAAWKANIPYSATGAVTLEIQRVGSTISFYYDAGSGLQLLATEPGQSTGVTGVAYLGFWGGGGPSAQAFDNLQIQADGFQAPEPATWSLGLAGGLFCLGVVRRRARGIRPAR